MPSKLVPPRDNRARKQSLAKDSSAKRTESRIMMSRLVISPEYKALKEMAKAISFNFRSSPGNTTEEDVSYLKHSTILWAFNSMFRQVENLAQTTTRTVKDDNDGW